MRNRSNSNTYKPYDERRLARKFNFPQILVRRSLGGYYQCSKYDAALPPAEVSDDYWWTIPEMGGQVSEIVDEIPMFQYMGNVAHTKKDLGIIPTTTSVHNVEVMCMSAVQHDGHIWKNPSLFRLRPSSYHVGRIPGAQALRWARAKNVRCNVVDASKTTYPASQEVDLASLIPRIMKRLDRFNGAAFLYELRELPKLASWVARRASIAKMVLSPTVKNRGAVDYTRTAFRRYWKARHPREGSFHRLSATQKSIAISGFLSMAVQDNYLGWIFGLAPTVGDSLDLARELSVDKGSKHKFTVTGRTNYADPAYAINAQPGDYGYYAGATVTNTINHQMVGGCTVTYNRAKCSDWVNDTNRNIASFLGHNAAGQAWAVLPFSFMVDWFFGIDKAVDSAWLKHTSVVSTEWWRSRKTTVVNNVSYPVLTSVTGRAIGVYDGGDELFPSGPYDERFSRRDVTTRYEIIDNFSYYERVRAVHPSIVSSLKVPELPSIGQAFIGALIAIGMVDKP